MSTIQQELRWTLDEHNKSELRDSAVGRAALFATLHEACEELLDQYPEKVSFWKKLFWSFMYGVGYIGPRG